MNRKIVYTFLVALLCLPAAGLMAQMPAREVAVVLEQPRQEIPDCDLVDRLADRLSRANGYSVYVPSEDSAATALPNRHYDLQRLLEWGKETGCRYIIYLQIDDRRIETKKQISFPLIVSHYVVQGCLEGMYTLVDMRRGKAVMNKCIRTFMTGPHQWQVFEDNRDDPDLHIPAPEKLIFLRQLEEKAAQEIFESVLPHLRGR
jgi:hypothetical protein